MRTCTCAVKDPRKRTCPMHPWGRELTLPCDRGDWVPGYAASADGVADARDQRKADQT